MTAATAPAAARLQLSFDMEQVAAWYAAGESTRAIGSRLGVSEKTVWRHMKARGIPLRTQAEASTPPAVSAAARRRNAELASEVTGLAAGGMDDMKIARRLGMAQTTVRRIRHQAGIPAAARLPTTRPVPIDMETALAMWRDSAAVTDIAAALGTSAAIVSARLAEVGCEAGSRNPLERIPELGAEAARMINAGMTAAGISRVLDVTCPQIHRFADKRGLVVAMPVAECGTPSGYSAGCRCEPCTEAHRAEAQKMRRRRQREVAAGSDAVPHGTFTGYHNWGCRCPDCKAKGSESNAYCIAARRIKAGAPVSALTALQQAAWLARQDGAA